MFAVKKFYSATTISIIFLCSLITAALIPCPREWRAEAVEAPYTWSGKSTTPVPHYKRTGGHDGGLELQYYTVSTPEQLAGLSEISAAGVPVYLTCDIWLNPDTDQKAKAFKPLSFSGEFDGQGHTIHNLYINTPETNNVGLFSKGVLDLKDLIVTGSVSGKLDTGGIVGYLSGGRISSVTNKCAVNGYTEVGGIAGYAGGAITNCKNYGSVTADNITGGIAGTSDKDITSSYNFGMVTAEKAAGGITAGSSGKISSCVNYGKISAQQHAGGICGPLIGKIIECVNYGAISGQFYIGGICSRTYTSSGYTGAVAKSSNFGAVEGSNLTGGVTGYNMGTIDSTNNWGPVTANILVGGIAGQNKGTINGCSSAGTITSHTANYNGGIAGTNDGDGTIKDSYYQQGSASGVAAADTGKVENSGSKGEDYFDYLKNQTEIALSDDLHIPVDTTYYVSKDTKLTAPAQVEITVDGTLHNDGTVLIKNDAALIVADTGKITGSGSIIVENGGKIVNNGSGPLNVSDSAGTQHIIESGESFAPGAKEAKQSDVVLSKDLYIPEETQYDVPPIITVVVPETIAITDAGTIDNDGEIIIKNGGKLTIEETGKITGSGTIVVEAGGTVTNNSASSIVITIGGKEITVKPGESYTYRETLTITAQAETGGEITPSGTISAAHGQSVTFTITPDKDYEIENVAIDGKAIGAVTSYTFSDLAESHTIQAFFKAKEASSDSSSSGSGCNTAGPKGTLYFFAPIVLYAGAHFMLKKMRRKQPCEKNTEKE